jgi:predicted dehydrogenase
MTLQVGIIGCGKMGQQHADGYRMAPDLARVVQCADPDLAAAQTLAQAFQAETTSDWRALLDNPAVDAVSICTPHHLHAPLVQAALAAGKHILLEKPMALNLEEARQMVQAADDVPVVFMVGQNHRYLPEHTIIKSLLDNQIIGEIYGVRLDGNQWLSRIYPPGHWLFAKATAGGGVIRTTAIHKLDIMRYFVGEIRRVAAFARTSGLNPGMDCEDVAAISLEFENGAVGEAFFTFAAHRLPIPSATGELTILYGTEGLLQNTPEWQVYSTRAPEYQNGLTSLGLPHADYALSFQQEVRHFLECIHHGREPLTSARDNLRTMAVIEAIYDAIDSGQAVTVAEG